MKSGTEKQLSYMQSIDEQAVRWTDSNKNLNENDRNVADSKGFHSTSGM